jgi:hypothetical protein
MKTGIGDPTKQVFKGIEKKNKRLNDTSERPYFSDFFPGAYSKYVF